MRAVKVILYLGVLANLANCAPNNAFKIRSERPYTLGMVGAMVRPSGKHAVGVGYNANYSNVKRDVEQEEAVGLVSTPGDSMKLTQATSSSQVSGFYHYFPWDTSGFFVGLGGRAERNKYETTLTTEGEGYESKSEEELSSTSVALALPLGWTWIWNNGFTLSFDFGPRWKVQEKFAQDPGPLYKLRQDGRLSLGGASVIGYSF